MPTTQRPDSAATSQSTGPARSGFDIVEINFDGLVGPTHNYAGLSHGNLASEKHAATVSHPKQAALQGLAKMKLLSDLGVPQAVIPPQPRPCLEVLRELGFHGSDAEVTAKAHREAPKLLAAVYSSSFMWTANAATISPAADAAAGLIQITPANLLTQFHRSIESQSTAQTLRQIFSGDEFVHHDPLPAADAFADEGAANHFRLCGDYGSAGLEIFVYGRDESSAPSRFPARQTKQACEAIVRRHGLDLNRTLILRQSPAAIDAGAFHSDVVVASNRDMLLAHRSAFADASAIDQIRRRFGEVTGCRLHCFVAEPEMLSLADAVSTYIFNSQIVTLPDGTMAIIAAVECREHAGAQRYLERILSSDCPVKAVHYVDLRQSMNNGGGPACLRLRVVMARKQAHLLDDGKYGQLCSIVTGGYRDELRPADLADPNLVDESQTIAEEIHRVLGLN